MADNSLTQAPSNILPQPVEEDMSFRTKEQKIESCVLQLKKKGMSKDAAFAMCTSSVNNSKKASEVDELIKQFADASSKYSVGLTSKDGDPKHSHTYTVMMLNYGAQLIGVTTATKGAENHVHSINMKLDQKLTYIEGYTSYSSLKQEGEITSTEMHEHLIKVDIEKLIEENPNITVSGYYFNENGEMVKGDVKEALNNMFNESALQNASAASEQPVVQHAIVPAEDCHDNKGRYCFNTPRQAEILINRIAQLSETPSWYKKTLADLQATIVNAIDAKYPDHSFDDINIVGELCIQLAAGKKLDPKAKVRNRGDVIFPANSSDVTDKKDHFPMNTAAQARNALARVAQYNKVPSWYKGSLAALQQKVRRAVKAKYPKVDVTGLTEFYALRFKEASDVFFVFLNTQNVDAAKHDASVYFSENEKMEVEVVKFESKEDGESKFTDLGSIMFFDTAKNTRKVGNDVVINLAERDDKGLVKIEVLRTGTFNHEIYGTFVIDNAKLNEMVANFKKGVLDRDLSFDMNHMPELPAAAWVRDLSVGRKEIKGEKRDVLFAHAKPTPLGEQSLKNEEFKYFSAEYTDHFVDKETGKDYGTVLKGGGFTNRPWMPGLAPVQFSEQRHIGFVPK